MIVTVVWHRYHKTGEVQSCIAIPKIGKCVHTANRSNAFLTFALVQIYTVLPIFS